MERENKKKNTKKRKKKKQGTRAEERKREREEAESPVKEKSPFYLIISSRCSDRPYGSWQQLHSAVEALVFYCENEKQSLESRFFFGRTK